MAVAMADGPAPALALVDELASVRAADRLPPAARHPRRPAAPRRPHGEAGRPTEEALELAPTEAERRYLGRRLSEVS